MRFGSVRNGSPSSKYALAFGVLLLSTYGAAHEAPARHLQDSTEATLSSASEAYEAASSSKFSCLPKDVRADEVVSYGRKGKQRVTVEDQLAQMKARCRKGKLVDRKGREVRFFHPSCWGNPPPDYLEIRQRENRELAELKKRYTVIVFGCNPMIE